MMEEQWLAYLRENNPELYEQAVSSVKWAAEWRDKQLAAANADLKALKSENELLRHKAAGNDTTMLRAELAAANARVAELEVTLKEIAKGSIVYPDLFAQQSLKDTKNSGCPYGVQPSKRCCKVCNELENILFKCNQEIVKQTCKTEQLQQQLAAANARVAELEDKSATYWKWFREQLDLNNARAEHAEQAEKNFEDAKDKIAMIGAEIVRLSEGKEQAEAQCAAAVNAMNECRQMLNEFIDITRDKRIDYGRANYVSKKAMDVLRNKNIAGTAILTRMKRMEEALKEIANTEFYGELSVHGVKNKAKAALEVPE